MSKHHLNRRNVLLGAVAATGALAVGSSFSTSFSTPAHALSAGKPGNPGRPENPGKSGVAPGKLKQTANAAAGASAAYYVFSQGDATGSAFFRIPFLINTSAGTVIAGTDANFGSTGDSADNIDCALRRKPSAGRYTAANGWQPASVPNALHMRDYADEYAYQQESASLIDGVILQDTLKTQRLHIVIDLFAWNGGIFEYMNITAEGDATPRRSRKVAPGDGFAKIGDRHYLLLSSTNTTGDGDGKTGNLNRNLDRAKFDHVADIYGPQDANGRATIYTLNGTPRPYGTTANPVDDSNLSLGAATTYSITPDLIVYDGDTQQTTPQKNAAGTVGPGVPLKLAYKASPLQMYNTSYLYHVTSDDDGKTWQPAGLISGGIKTEDSTYFITGPGNAIQVQRGTYKGRLIVPIYCGGALERAGVMFSDDNGATWAGGKFVPATINLSESNVVERPDGSLQIYARTNGSGNGRVSTAISTDGGATWSAATSAFGDTDVVGIACQVSAVSLPYEVTLSDGSTAPGVAVTTAMAKTRDNGVVHIGGFVAAGAPGSVSGVEWVGQYELTGATKKFAYSSMAVLANDNLAVLFESSETARWVDGLHNMYYVEIAKTDLPLTA